MNKRAWNKNAVFYELHTRAFYDSNNDGIGDIRGVIQKLDYIKQLGVDCIWLLPIFPSPLKDGGYDISDFYNVHPDLGTLEDFKELINETHKKDMHIITDMVVNHTSDQCDWFKKAELDSQSPYHDFYVWSDTNNKFQDARIIFFDTETSNWTWSEKAGQYYWHRFFSSQPDLNYDNTAVREEMKNIMRFWLDMGIDGFRMDAVPYLIEREGTDCENLSETHEYLKELRVMMEKEYPGRILLAEANQWPRDLLPYLADGDEFHMAFHFPIMPKIFKSIAIGNCESLIETLRDTPAIPDGCQWCTFLRNHDELTLEMVTEEDRQLMWDMYAPEERMRLNLGIRRRLAPLLDGDMRKIELLYAILFSLPGAPIVYYGDEIGMGDNIWLNDRDGVRTPMQWTDSKNAGFSNANSNELFLPLIDSGAYDYQKVNVKDQKKNPDSFLNRLKKMIAVRKRNPVFATQDYAIWDEENKEVFSIQRSDRKTTLLCIHNLTDKIRIVGLKEKKHQVLHTSKDALENDAVLTGNFALNPFGYIWLIEK